jgi:RNA polymerase sigma-70 factor (sigma-E family)
VAVFVEPGHDSSGSEPGVGASGSCAGWEEAAVTGIYRIHFQPLVRQAAVLVGHAAAEEVVQECFIAMYHAWGRLRDSRSAVGYLRRSVTNRSTSVLRHQAVAARHATWAAELPSAEEEALVLLERSAVVSALRALPPRQRQAISLRYYADLPEAQIAAIMGVSEGTVKTHIFRAVTSLRVALDERPVSPLGSRLASRWRQRRGPAGSSRCRSSRNSPRPDRSRPRQRQQWRGGWRLPSPLKCR